MTSYERYVGSAVPILLAVASVMSRKWLRGVTIVSAAVLLGAYSAMAFTHLYVP